MDYYVDICVSKTLGCSRKKTNRERGRGHGISRGIEEVEGGISKKTINFPGVINTKIGKSISLGFWFWNFQGA